VVAIAVASARSSVITAPTAGVGCYVDDRNTIVQRDVSIATSPSLIPQFERTTCPPGGRAHGG